MKQKYIKPETEGFRLEMVALLMTSPGDMPLKKKEEDDDDYVIDDPGWIY